MPKLERWIIASKKVRVLDTELEREILGMGGVLGGGFSEIHRHILVNPENKEVIEEHLRAKGYTVLPGTDKEFFHPDTEHIKHSASA
ncbi:MAG: hypothetical protein JXR97_17295 [Planctomycetes bacterium]|nr:hypothetical protein [Planctomycetota bacterium]